MESLSDVQLVKNIQEFECNDSLKELFKRHHKTCAKVTTFFEGSGNYPNGFTDEKEYLLYRAAKKFDPTRNMKFNSYLWNSVKYYCLDALKKNNMIPCPNQIIENIPSNIDTSEECNYKDMVDEILIFLDHISDERIKKIIKQRYFSTNKSEMTWKSIGKSVGVSIQGAIYLHDKFMTILKDRFRDKETVFV